MKTERRGEWVGYWPAGAEPALAGIDVLLRLVETPGAVLKDDRRTFLKRVAFSGLDIAAKQPRDKNRRLWIRLLPLIRSSEARVTLVTLQKLLHAGVPSVVPLAALERRWFGIVVDSWLFYRYREGRACGEQHLPGIIQTLNAIHRAGFRHEDPHFENFLQDGREVFVLDIKGKPRLGRVSDYYDFMLFEQRTGAPLDAYTGAREQDWWYRAAVVYGTYRGWRKKIKEWIRGTVLRRRGRL